MRALTRLHSLRRVPFFFFNDTATTEIYTLSLHDALPISPCSPVRSATTFEPSTACPTPRSRRRTGCARDRKSTRLNSSHGYISYAVFCLKKKKTKTVYSQTDDPITGLQSDNASPLPLLLR